MTNHQLLDRLLALWNDKCAGGALPARADFDVLELRDWLGHLMLVEVRRGGAEFYYRLYGSALAAAFGRDLTGKTSEALPPETQDTVHREYRAAVQTRRPIIIEHERYAPHSYRAAVKLVLPLASDGETVDLLLVGAYPI
jgi:hypothetical protein